LSASAWRRFSRRRRAAASRRNSSSPRSHRTVLRTRWAAALAAQATVNRALKLIDAGALDGGDVAELADRLGIGSRHLARLFRKHLGSTPSQLARSMRVQRAKRLIDETTLLM
jgi:transcriptional regulator GlxA family with amidase domain